MTLHCERRHMRMLAHKVFFKVTGHQEVKAHILVHVEPVNRYYTTWFSTDSFLGWFSILPRGERGQSENQTSKSLHAFIPRPLATLETMVTVQELGYIEHVTIVKYCVVQYTRICYLS